MNRNYNELDEPYHALYTEHVTIMRFAGSIFCNVGKVCKIFSILASAMNILDFVFANQGL